MAPNIYLTLNEENALRSLAKSESYADLAKACVVPPYGIHLFTQLLRRKTGIHDTKDTVECANYIRKYAEIMANPKPSEEQLSLLRLFLKRDTYTAIAYQLTMARGSAPLQSTEIPRLMDNACEAVGIFTRDDATRRVQIRIYLAAFHTLLYAPLFEEEETLLRQWIAGRDPLEIADDMGERGEYVRYRIKKACRKLGMCAKGRGVQITLVRAYFAQLDAKKKPEITMDDPAF